jgi:hypothetical protein
MKNTLITTARINAGAKVVTGAFTMGAVVLPTQP